MKSFFKNPYKNLEKKLGYSFRDKNLLATALMHRSFRFETHNIEHDNQRLEFLGDSALGLVATDYLFNKHPNLEEGPLTSLRSQMASGKALAKIGLAINLGDNLKLGKGEMKSGGNQRASNVMDAMEAVLGSAYLDGGLKAVRKIFNNLFIPMIKINPEESWLDNPKGQLQQITQKKWKINPTYHVIKQDGPSHLKLFTIEVIVNEMKIGVGKGSTKQEAEQQAAQNTIQILHNEKE